MLFFNVLFCKFLLLSVVICCCLVYVNMLMGSGWKMSDCVVKHKMQVNASESLRYFVFASDFKKSADEMSDKSYDRDAVAATMRMRRQRVQEFCKKKYKQQTLLKYAVTRRLLINKDHGITWCPICKAGSTIWMRIFGVLGGEIDPSTRLPDPGVQVSKLARKAHPFLGTSAVIELLNKTTKFLIVRHPFERLLSAFRDKIQDKTKTYYYKKYSKHILKWYRKTPSDLTVPTFEEFLLYIVNERDFDEHWTPYHQECSPCFVKYDFILKMETFDVDQRFLIDSINDDEVQRVYYKHGSRENMNPMGRTQGDVSLRYFEEIPYRLLKDVYKIYEMDFLLFNYVPDMYFKMANKT